jgi:hypothetical protein
VSQLAKRVSLVSVLVAFPGCGADGSSAIDSTPQKLDGTESHEFEQDDVDAAAGASDAVKDYCADAVSEAQQLECESHLTDDEIP